MTLDVYDIRSYVVYYCVIYTTLGDMCDICHIPLCHIFVYDMSRIFDTIVFDIRCHISHVSPIYKCLPYTHLMSYTIVSPIIVYDIR